MRIRTDTERLDFLDSLTGRCGAGQVILRMSLSGRGWRLHETSREGSFGTVREAIDWVMGNMRGHLYTKEGPKDPVVIDMLRGWLKEHGYDGLYNPESLCGCEATDLMPCGEITHDCQAGIKRLGCSDECDMGCDFHIVPRWAPAEYGGPK